MNIPFLSGDNPDEIIDELGQLTGEDDLAKEAESAIDNFTGQSATNAAGDDDSDSDSDDDSDSDSDNS